MPELERIEIPNRSLFRQPEVCEIAHIQPYVLRSWEAEFPDLGVEKTAGGPRMYRRADVERVLRLKQLVYGDGLTLAGARRKLAEEQPAPAAEPVDLDAGDVLGDEVRQRLRQVQQTLRALAAMLAQPPGTAPAPAAKEEPFELRGAEAAKSAAKAASRGAASRPSTGRKRR
jgi:DNA-binding transcriptional MerR regulator